WPRRRRRSPSTAPPTRARRSATFSAPRSSGRPRRRTEPTRHPPGGGQRHARRPRTRVRGRFYADTAYLRIAPSKWRPPTPSPSAPFAEPVLGLAEGETPGVRGGGETAPPAYASHPRMWDFCRLVTPSFATIAVRCCWRLTRCGPPSHASPESQSKRHAMSLDADHIVDRRRMRRKLTFWRALAVAVAIVAIGAFAVLRGPRDIIVPGTDRISRVTISGIILGNRDRVEALTRLSKASDTRAVIVHVDSPGGTVAGSEQLYRALRLVAEKKPTVVVVDGTAASGGYLAAMAADHIVAQDNSIVGSIGV